MNYEDFFSVKISGITMPRIQGLETPAQLLAHHARVSNTANQFNHLTGPALLRALVRRKEWSPFEMVSLTAEVQTTRDIAHQILRHGKAFGFQEYSQRYAQVVSPIVLKEARLQHPTDRQMSIETDDPGLAAWWAEAQTEVNELARAKYSEALQKGLAKETARSVLPEGNTPTTLYMAGWLRSWIHYIGLRGENKTQKEHRVLAESSYVIVQDEFPELKSVLNNYYELSRG